VADRLRLFGRRLADLGSTLVDAFVRDNRVLPPVLAVLALFIIAWILAGAFMGEPDQETVAHKADLAQSDLAQSDLAQSDGGNSGSDPAPGVENRDVNSYAAYRSKDPFREILAPEKTTPEQPTTTPEQTTPETTTGQGRPGGGPGAGSATRDKDRDGVPDRRERRVGTSPNNPDTDGDGTPDGSDDDANGDGRPDTGGSGAGPGTGTTTPGAGQPGSGGNQSTGGNGDGLLNSGGTLPVP
jgi:hypothetical protein